MTWIKSGMINQFVQSMIVSSLWTCEGNHATSIVHCDAVPTGYLGMDFDPETLLYIEGGRPYDPAAGRYLTAGSMAAGTYNIYAFASNTPVDRSVRDVRGAGMQGIVGGSPIGAGIRAMVDGVVDSIWTTFNSFKDGAIAAGEHIRDSWYELSDHNWDAFQNRQSDFFRSWVSHSTLQQFLEPSWLNQKHGPVTTFATHPSWVASERAAFKTYFETSNGTTSWGYGERFAPLGDEIIVTVASSVTGRLIPPGAATLARSSRFLIKHLDDVIDVGVDGGRVIARGGNAPVKGAGFHKLIDEGISGVDDVFESRAFREALANDPTARRLYLRMRESGVDVVLDHRYTPGNLAGEVVEHAGKPRINIYLGNNSSTQKALATFLHETRHADDILKGRATFAGGNSLRLESRAIRRERIWELGRKLTRDEWNEIKWSVDVPGSGLR
jgi:RHS repeat-associated protein